MCVFAVPLIFALLQIFLVKGGALRNSGICTSTFYRDSNCSKSEFRCFDGACIDRSGYCNDVYDCNDDSDETFCSVFFGCESSLLRKCVLSNKCIPVEWFCDGIEDCPGGVDETCDEFQPNEQDVKLKALNWLGTQKDKRPTNFWGPLVDKLAVAFYLGNNTWLKENEATRQEMAYELSIRLLSRLSKKKLKDIPSYELASYVNAFLVTCLNPRFFHRFNLVQELRNRVDGQNDTNPYVILSLCNAGDTITLFDRRKLISTFENKRREHWTDIRSLAVMALVCANKQSEEVDLTELVRLFVEHYENETVGSVQTTALVMQALISANTVADVDSFNETEAMEKILAKQMDTGSFGNVINTYYVLPVLNCQSLVDISSDHCESYSSNETLELEELTESHDSQIRLGYSIWIGNNSNVESNLSLMVPANVSFYKVMQIAAHLDSHYSFEYVVLNDKPYVTAILGKQDDPEKGEFWFLYDMKNRKPVFTHKSPADIMPQDKDHYLLWYHGGLWTD